MYNMHVQRIYVHCIYLFLSIYLSIHPSIFLSQPFAQVNISTVKLYKIKIKVLQLLFVSFIKIRALISQILETPASEHNTTTMAITYYVLMLMNT